ncbi:radical SAM protein [Sorangium sp. So ce513]|uniref:radical SAM protein n=2 Tax=unclassified Sorangium TaxID=2621164 RepID=UPI003F61F9CC
MFGALNRVRARRIKVRLARTSRSMIQYKEIAMAQPGLVDIAGKTPRNVEDFTQAQALASRRLGFVVTKACPLRCAHCSVSAAPELGHTTFSSEYGDHIASQMPALRAIDVRFIDFTGGEPTLATSFVQKVSAAAKACGQSCGIVTAGHWAKNEASAQRAIEKFPDIDNWDISTDVYHLPFVPLEWVDTAFHSLLRAGKNALIRIAHHEPITHDDAVLIDKVYQFAGRRIAFQPIGPVGRGNDLLQLSRVDKARYDRSPCPTTGPLVQPGGQVAPCCAPLSHEEYDHPLRLGNTQEEPLTAIVERWRIHPLLQTLRLWGFEPVIDWFEGNARYEHILRQRMCHQCVELIRDRELCSIAMEQASRFTHRIKVAYALKTQFGEDWLDLKLRAEATALLGCSREVSI